MKNTTRIGVVLVISVLFFSAEIAVGFRTKSIALIADAFHYLNDIVAYAIAFVAAYLQETGQPTLNFTYAFHRAELVGAFFNGVFLLALALSICLQSIERFVHVEIIDSPKLVLIIGCIGLCLNIISALFVHDHHGHGDHGNGHGHSHSHRQAVEPLTIGLTEINTQLDHIHAGHNHATAPPTNKPERNLGMVGVLIHLLGDAVNNVGVIIAAVIMWKVNSEKRFYADPSVSLLISVIIFASAIPMTLKSGRILLEAAPLYLDLEKVKADLTTVPEVLSIHDLHVWHLSQSVILGSLHVRVASGTSLEQWEKTEQYLQHCFSEYGISHVTISPEIEKNGPEALQDRKDMPERCKSPAHDDFGCTVNELRKRKVGA